MAHLYDAHAPPIAYMPVRRQLQPVEVGPYPQVAPAIMRLLDDAMARAFADERRALEAMEEKKAQAQGGQEYEQEVEEEGDGKAFSITLGELARRTPPLVDDGGAPLSAAARARQQRRREEWVWVKRCMGREVERMLDAMIRDGLAQTSQRRAARCDALGPGQQAAAAVAAAAREKREGNGRVVGTEEEEGLIDWKDVLECAEARRRQKAATDAERAKPVSAAARARARAEAFKQFKRRKREGKKDGAKKGNGDRGGKAAAPEAYEPDWRVLEPALDPGVLARTRAGLEKLFGPAEKQKN